MAFIDCSNVTGGQDVGPTRVGAVGSRRTTRIYFDLMPHACKFPPPKQNITASPSMFPSDALLGMLYEQCGVVDEDAGLARRRCLT